MAVGEVAGQFGVTGAHAAPLRPHRLLSPTSRSATGYRLYTDADLTRLQHIVIYRRLGFTLGEIAVLLDDRNADVATHLRRQRAAVVSRMGELRDVVQAIDRALEAQMSGVPLTRQEQQELFGNGFSDEYAQEAEQRWGETAAWQQSRRRTSQYTKDDWYEIKAEEEVVTVAFVEAKRTGEQPTSERAMDAAERHRRHIHNRFYDLSYPMHRGLAEMYVADPRFASTYEDREPGVAEYVRDAVQANAARHGYGDAAD